jgi:hypothetical protein
LVSISELDDDDAGETNVDEPFAVTSDEGNSTSDVFGSSKFSELIEGWLSKIFECKDDDKTCTVESGRAGEIFCDGNGKLDADSIELAEITVIFPIVVASFASFSNDLFNILVRFITDFFNHTIQNNLLTLQVN